MAMKGVSKTLDLSFRNIESVEDIAECVLDDQIEEGVVEEVEQLPPELAELAASVGSTAFGNVASGEEPKQPEAIRKRYNIVKLSNNDLSSLAGLRPALERVVRDVEEIRILDLSFNKIRDEDLGDALLQFPKLQILYLQSNRIDELAPTLHALRQLSSLRGLRLDANPMSNTGAYRATVVASLPTLKKLDTVVVSPGEASMARSLAERKREARRARAAAGGGGDGQ